MSERPAIDGGTPVRTTPLPYARQVVDEDDIASVAAVLRGDWLTTGPAVAEYESAFAARVGARHAIAVSSGTAALHAAVFTVGIGPGDEVITTPLTFAATSNAVLYCGGIPVFVDVQADTGNIDPEATRRAITSKTKAVIAVDFAGQPADLDVLREICAANTLVLIEDAAHALGAVYKGRPAGAWSDLTAFSTHPVKHIATGEGGIVATDRDDWAEALRAFRNHGIRADAHVRAERGDWFYEMDFLGNNYRMPDILCALGRSQLGKLDGWLARRRAIATRYDEAFRGFSAIDTPVVRAEREHAWHLYVIRLNLNRLSVDRQHVFRAFRAEGIMGNVHYIPVYWHPHYERQGYRRGLCPIAESIYERSLSLPMWAGMTDGDVDDVIAAVGKIVRAYGR